MGWSFKRRKGQVSAPTDPLPSPTDRLFATLKAIGLSPRHVVDVGGNHGNWTRAALAAFPEARISMFEPQQKLAEKHADIAKNERVAIYYKGVGDFDGSAPFTFHTRDDSSSFVYSAGQAVARGFVQGEVEICRLDTTMATSTFGRPDIVKIDAEGLDLKVLDGAPDTIANAQIVLIEAAVACPRYPNTAEIIFRKMDELGFRLFDITDLNRTPTRGVLWLIEAVFIRKDAAFASSVAEYR